MLDNLSGLQQSAPLPQDSGDSFYFDEPWQAQAFAITLELNRQGHFSWTEWVAVFSKEIQTHPATPEEGHIIGYYRQWLTALETIMAQRGISQSPEIEIAQERWRSAYLHTQHGRPIELGNDERQHDAHEHMPLKPILEPIAISPARTRQPRNSTS
jgi:nitrile hydratase accessory protein